MLFTKLARLHGLLNTVAICILATQLVHLYLKSRFTWLRFFTHNRVLFNSEKIMNIQGFRLATATALALFLTACASSGNSGGGNWQSIGTTSNGNIKVSVDKSSIKKNGQLVTFRDRKVISKLSEEQFANTPAYKTALAEWEIHCGNKTYRLTALQLQNEHGKTVTHERYTATNLRPMSVMNGTITEKQYEMVCGKKL